MPKKSHNKTKTKSKPHNIKDKKLNIEGKFKSLQDCGAKFFKKFKKVISFVNYNKDKVSVKTHEGSIFSNFDNLATTTVEDVMIPRSDISAVKSDVTISDLSKSIVEQGHTRTLVYNDNLDNVIGFIHIKDLFAIISQSESYDLKKLIRPHLVSPHSMKLIDLFTQMQEKRTHIAVVVDEYGGTDGIVTIEDIIEKIVGRAIDDEHDDAEEIVTYKILKSGVIIASARVEVEEIEKILSVTLKEEDDDFDTIGGMVLARTGQVPDKGDIIQLTEEVSVEILDATPRNIQRLKITCQIPA